MNRLRSRSGFTIVELLIVIVVIGILAALVISTFAGAQERARDADRKADLAAIAKALATYNIDKGDFVSAGGGCASGGGWYHHDYDSTGPLLSISQCLVNGKYMASNINDPQASRGCTQVVASPLEEDCFYYMKYDCDGGSYVFANLESMPHSSTDVDGVCSTYRGLDSRYGMNYYVRVN